MLTIGEEGEGEGEGEGEEARYQLLPPPQPPTTTTPRVISLLSLALERLVARNDRIFESFSGAQQQAEKRLGAFNGVRAPSISIEKYLERVYKYTACSPSCLVVGFVYMDRVAHVRPGSPLTSLNVHRLLVTSIMVASKMMDDVHQNNAFYARVGGISNAELNALELELLFLLDFCVMVSSRVFETYCLHLEKVMDLHNGDDDCEKMMRVPPSPSDDARDYYLIDAQDPSSNPSPS